MLQTYFKLADDIIMLSRLDNSCEQQQKGREYLLDNADAFLLYGKESELKIEDTKKIKNLM